jgi:hypothetical protein
MAAVRYAPELVEYVAISDLAGLLLRTLHVAVTREPLASDGCGTRFGKRFAERRHCANADSRLPQPRGYETAILIPKRSNANLERRMSRRTDQDRPASFSPSA